MYQIDNILVKYPKIKLCRSLNYWYFIANVFDLGAFNHAGSGLVLREMWLFLMFGAWFRWKYWLFLVPGLLTTLILGWFTGNFDYFWFLWEFWLFLIFGWFCWKFWLFNQEITRSLFMCLSCKMLNIYSMHDESDKNCPKKNLKYTSEIV